ncbi:MAG TPA: histidinol dehydrogenase [Xanthomonadaceae bacterium]|nr:histidinol dehydrogenase [Xanthomonadaceae bacterium]
MPRVDWAGLDAAARARVLARPRPRGGQDLGADVAAILQAVRREGDAALHRFAQRFDGIDGAALASGPAMGPHAFAAARERVDPALAGAIARAAARIEAFHRATMAGVVTIETAPGVVCERILRPLRRVGLYVPAGSAPLPSSVLMLALPARLAGCQDIVLCSPPGRDGRVAPEVLVAAAACGVDRVFAIGGAQAIAAMAYGTGSVPACDKLFGPGNAWVTEAKRQVATGTPPVAVDMPAGPSEVLVVADAGANPAFVAADLLSQAEHGPDSQALLASDSPALLDAVQAELARQLAALPRRHVAQRALAGSFAIDVPDIGTAIALANDHAPEHLILALREPRAWLDRVHCAGSVFLGDWSPEALGDYCSGTNHVLPTGGAARVRGGLAVADFQRAISVQSVSPAGLGAIGPDAIALARAERLEAHARAVQLRLDAA